MFSRFPQRPNPEVRQYSGLEINCENYTPDSLNTFVQSCYPDNQLKQQKLKYLVSFYLFKGACKSMMSREPTRRIIKKRDGYEFYGGNYKLSWGKKPFVQIKNDVFDVIVDTTPFVSYTILQKIEESTNELMQNVSFRNSINLFEYGWVQETVLKVMCENMPGISTFNYLKNTGYMVGRSIGTLMITALNVVGVCLQFLHYYMVDKEKILKEDFLEKNIKTLRMIGDQQKNIMLRGKFRGLSLGDTELRHILHLIMIYTNLILFISYRGHFVNYHMIRGEHKEEDMRRFRDTYFSNDLLQKEYNPEFTNAVNNLIELRDIFSSLTFITNYVTSELNQVRQQQPVQTMRVEKGELVQAAGKKEKRKRLVDCTVKELKEKMKKKGKKLSKDGVPFTKSQMLRALKK